MIRLEYIKKTILDGKSLYSSDSQYVENLVHKYIQKDDQHTGLYSFEQTKHESKCWNCENTLVQLANYCSFCGVKQIKQFSNENPFVSRSANNRFKSLLFFGKVNSYQILAILGGLAALVPILIVLSRLDNILSSIAYYADEDLSSVSGVFISAGVISGLLSCFTMIIPFVIKNSKKVGRILFFTSFAILVTSILVGVIGFAIILFASMIAFKKRRY